MMVKFSDMDCHPQLCDNKEATCPNHRSKLYPIPVSAKLKKKPGLIPLRRTAMACNFILPFFLIWLINVGKSAATPTQSDSLIDKALWRTTSDKITIMGRSSGPALCLTNVNQIGVCVFLKSCLEMNGRLVGTCAKSFFFASCCVLPNTTDSIQSLNGTGSQDNFLQASSSSSVKHDTIGLLTNFISTPEDFPRNRPALIIHYDKKNQTVSTSSPSSTIAHISTIATNEIPPTKSISSDPSDNTTMTPIKASTSQSSSMPSTTRWTSFLNTFNISDLIPSSIIPAQSTPPPTNMSVSTTMVSSIIQLSQLLNNLTTPTNLSAINPVNSTDSSLASNLAINTIAPFISLPPGYVVLTNPMIDKTSATSTASLFSSLFNSSSYAGWTLANLTTATYFNTTTTVPSITNNSFDEGKNHSASSTLAPFTSLILFTQAPSVMRKSDSTTKTPVSTSVSTLPWTTIAALFTSSTTTTTKASSTTTVVTSASTTTTSAPTSLSTTASRTSWTKRWTTPSTSSTMLTSTTPIVVEGGLKEGSDTMTSSTPPGMSVDSDGQTPVTLSDICGITPLLWQRDGSDRDARIVGGSEAKFGEFPWQVSLRRIVGQISSHRCGAALVHPRWVITAAHCASDIPTNRMIVRIGEYDFRDSNSTYPHVDIRVSERVIHQKFNFLTFENDIALLRLAEPVKLAPHIIPVCLAPYKNYTGSYGTISGWGRLSQGGALPPILHKVQDPFISKKDCESWFDDGDRHQDIEPVFICAGYKNGGRDACQGDSGGPVVQKVDGRWALVGVISWGIGCAEPNLPGVSTLIPLFADWIKNNSEGDVYLPEFYLRKYGPAPAISSLPKASRQLMQL